jgi:hypothetical protein
MRVWGRAAIGLAGVYLLLLGGLAVAMRQPPAVFGRVMSHVPGPMFLLFPFETLWRSARAGDLDPGEAAPDFSLPTLDRTARVRLSELRGRPVVLVFGSYT